MPNFTPYRAICWLITWTWSCSSLNPMEITLWKWFVVQKKTKTSEQSLAPLPDPYCIRSECNIFYTIVSYIIGNSRTHVNESFVKFQNITSVTQITSVLRNSAFETRFMIRIITPYFSIVNHLCVILSFCIIPRKNICAQWHTPVFHNIQRDHPVMQKREKAAVR